MGKLISIMVTLISIVFIVYIIYKITHEKHKDNPNLLSIKDVFVNKNFIDEVANAIKHINFDKELDTLKASNKITPKMYQKFYKEVVTLKILLKSVKMIALASIKFYDIKKDDNIPKLQTIKILEDILDNGKFDYLDTFIKTVCETSKIVNDVEVKISAKDIKYAIDVQKKSLFIVTNQPYKEKMLKDYNDYLASIEPYKDKEHLNNIKNSFTDQNFIHEVADIVKSIEFDQELEFFNDPNEITPLLYQKFCREVAIVKTLVEAVTLISLSNIKYYEINDISIIDNDSVKIFKTILNNDFSYLNNFMKAVFNISKIVDDSDIKVCANDITYAMSLLWKKKHGICLEKF